MCQAMVLYLQQCKPDTADVLFPKSLGFHGLRQRWQTVNMANTHSLLFFVFFLSQLNAVLSTLIGHDAVRAAEKVFWLKVFQDLKSPPSQLQNIV